MSNQSSVFAREEGGWWKEYKSIQYKELFKDMWVYLIKEMISGVRENKICPQLHFKYESCKNKNFYNSD